MSPSVHSVKDPKAISRRLKAARIVAGLSQRQLVAGLPYTAAYVSRIEAGARTPTVDCLRMLAERLGVSATWLETGRDVVDVELPRAEAERIADSAGQSGVTETLLGALMQSLGRSDDHVRGLA